MCQGVIVMVKSDGSKLIAGTGSHTALARKHNISNLGSYLSFETMALSLARI